MAKKYILIFFFLLAIKGFLLGQIDKEKTKFYQVGLNIGPLWSNLIHHQQVNPSEFTFPIFDTREVLSLKYRKNKKALRLGIGAQFIKQERDDNSTKQNNFLFRLGAEKQTDLTERWQCFYGVDFKFNFGKIKESFNNDPYKWDRVGLSSFFGIQYRLTSRLIFQTEASLNFFQTTTYNSNLFFIDPLPIFPIEPGGSKKTKAKSIDIVLPNILYLAFEF